MRQSPTRVFVETSKAEKTTTLMKIPDTVTSKKSSDPFTTWPRCQSTSPVVFFLKLKRLYFLVPTGVVFARIGDSNLDGQLHYTTTSGA